MAETPRYALPYGAFDDALLRLDTLLYGAWAPRIAAMVQATRTFAYHGGVNSAGTIIPDGTIVIPDGGTYFVQRDKDGVVTADAALDFPTKIPIARCTTAGGELTNFEDMRDLQLAQLVASVVAYVNAAIDGMAVGASVDATDYFATRTAGGVAEKVTALQILTYVTANIIVTTGMMGGDVTAFGKSMLTAANAAAGRSVLGLGTAALNATGDFEPAGTVATHAAVTSGVHGITAFAATLLDDANAGAMRTTLGLGTAALNATGDFEPTGAVATHAAVTSGVHGITAYIATLLDDANAGAARTTLGLGTAALNATGDFEPTGAVATHAAVTSGVHGITAFAAGLLDDANAAAARTTLGLGTAALNATGDFEAAGAVATHAAATSGVHGISAFAATFLDDTTAAAVRTTLGATTLGAALFSFANPSAIRFIRINADNSVTARTAAEMLSDLGALSHPQVMARVFFGF